MKTILLNVVLGILLSSFSVCENAEPLPKDDSFSASLENVKFEDDSSISLEFVLKNHTAKTIIIAERWNSWGAYQWTVDVTTADGRVIEFRNPQTKWGKNYLSTVSIEPGKELRLQCRLIAKQPPSHIAGIATFIAKENSPQITPSVRLVGNFEASLQSAGEVATNWEGSIKTPEVELKK